MQNQLYNRDTAHSTLAYQITAVLPIPAGNIRIKVQYTY